MNSCDNTQSPLYNRFFPVYHTKLLLIRLLFLLIRACSPRTTQRYTRRRAWNSSNAERRQVGLSTDLKYQLVSSAALYKDIVCYYIREFNRRKSWRMVKCDQSIKNIAKSCLTHFKCCSHAARVRRVYVARL